VGSGPSCCSRSMALRGTSEDARFADNAVLRGDNELGVAGVAQNLFEKVTQYHAQIGANVDINALQQLEWALLGEAKALFHQRKFEEALNTFTHCLAVTEKTRSGRDQAVRGAVVHNIASCLHNLGEMEAAQAYYDQAIEAFKKAKTPLLEKLFYGDPNRRRIDFVKERLVDITWGRKPDGDKYLDENGVKRPVPELGQLAPEPDGGNDEMLSERWREEGPPPPRLPGWMNNGMSDGVSSEYHSRPAEPHHVSSERYIGSGAPSTGSRAQPAARPQEAAAAALPDAEQEAARKEWLSYHMQMGEWEEAAELAVTREEKEDLEYLMQRQQREAAQGQHSGRSGPALAQTAPGVRDHYASGHGGEAERDDNLM